MRHEEDNEKLDIEALSEEETDAYLKVAWEDTPDLWDRISAGYDRELEVLACHDKENSSENRVVSIDKHASIRFRRVRNTIIVAAAIMLVAIIAAPILKDSFRTQKSDDKDKSCGLDADSVCLEDSTQMVTSDAEENSESDMAVLDELPTQMQETADNQTEAANGMYYDKAADAILKSATVTYNNRTCDLGEADINKIIDLALQAKLEIITADVKINTDAIVFEAVYGDNNKIKIIINDRDTYVYIPDINGTAKIDEATSARLRELADEIIDR